MTRPVVVGQDDELAATEIVRRCERRIGQLVREGQERGEIAKPGDIGAMPGPRTGGEPGNQRGEHLGRPGEVAGLGTAALTDHYTLADAPNDTFEAAIREARDEGNLSRANVVRRWLEAERDENTCRK